MIFGSHALHEYVIETTDTNIVGLWSSRSLVISTLVNSHLLRRMNFVNSKKSPLSETFDVEHGVDRTGCRIPGAGFRKGRFVLNNSKQKYKNFLNFYQISLKMK